MSQSSTRHIFNSQSTSDPSSHTMARSSSSEPVKNASGNSNSNGGSNSSSSSSSSKRKGTRSVSTLTPSQLARKRANDREAQRAIRARTKEHIERLEKELEELRSQQSRDQTVQELMRRNKALEDELHRLKETIGVTSMVNGAPGGPPPAAAPNASPYSANPGTASSSAATSAATSSMEIDSFGVLEGAVPSLTSSPFTVYDDAGPNSTRGSPFPGPGYDGSLAADYGAANFVPLPDNASNADGTNWPAVHNAIPSAVSSPSSSVDDYTTAAAAAAAAAVYMPTSMPNGMIPTTAAAGNGVVKMEFDDGDRAPRHWVPPTSQQRPPPTSAPATAPASAPAPGGYAHPRQHQQHLIARSSPAQHAMGCSPRHVPHVLPSTAVPGPLSQQQQPPTLWKLPVINDTPKSRADELLLSFVVECRRQPRMDAVRMMLGPAKMDVRALFPEDLRQFLPSTAVENMPPPPARSPLGDLITALVANVGLVRPLERLGVVAPMHSYVAWLAHPSRETQARVAPHLIPRISQLEIQHPSWVGMIHWGRLRCAIIHHQDMYGTDEFLRIYATSLRMVNWPPAASAPPSQQHQHQLDGAGVIEAAVETDPSTGQVWLSDSFMAHASRYDSWRLDMAFARHYPELANLVDLIDLC